MLRVIKRLATTTGVATAAVTGYIVVDDGRRKKAELTARAAVRIANLLSTAIVICTDYGYHYYVKHEEKVSQLEMREHQLLGIQSHMEHLNMELLNAPEEVKRTRTAAQEAALKKEIVETRQLMDAITLEISQLLEKGAKRFNELHTRNAVRLTKMCASNGGLYIKLGQHIAMLDYVVPQEYRTELTALLGQTPNSSIEAVRRVINMELADDPENLFDTFDPVPISSASLAQVHVATKDGVKYAVKVQHEGLATGAPVDQLVITTIVHVIHKLFPMFDYVWLAKEMNRNLPLELNFQCERGNIEKTTNLLRDFIARGEVAVPMVNASLSGRRVLTMTFEEGCYITNSRQVNEWGLSRTQIGHTVAAVFCEQIFKHGFVHCGEFSSVLLPAHTHL
jgi:predicted unusual protein kinase regulating ubiquinone biosynthesis (AarF/ABC1/UbiB family)